MQHTYISPLNEIVDEIDDAGGGFGVLSRLCEIDGEAAQDASRREGVVDVLRRGLEVA